MSDLAWQAIGVAGSILASGAVALCVLTPPTTRSFGPPLLGVAWALLLATVAPEPLRSHVAVLAALLLGVVACGAGATLLVQHRPSILLVIGALTLPIRIPIPLAGETYDLLLPLYAVVATSIGVLTTRTMRARPPTIASVRRIFADTPVLDQLLALMVMWSAMSVTWAFDTDLALQRMALMIIPFAILWLLLREVATEQNMVSAGRAFIAAMSVAAVLAIVQQVTHSTWQNPKVAVANAIGPVFRSNGPFWDPNILGRYLVLATLIIVAGVALQRLPHRTLGLAALMLAALAGTWSQSSMVGLAAGCVVLGLAALTSPSRRWTGRIILVLLLSCTIAAPLIGWSRLTGVPDSGGGRVTLVRGGLVLASFDPLRGQGLASFEPAYRELVEVRGARPRQLVASHTTPITVLVELGVIGLGIFAALLTAAGFAVSAATGQSAAPGRSGQPDAVAAGALPVAAWIAAAWLTSLVAHSMFYAALFEDPATWVALGVISAVTARSAVDASDDTDLNIDARTDVDSDED